MAAGGEKKVMGWLWQPVGGDHTHPAETPKDEVAASKRWSQNMRGPRLARITLVHVVMDKKPSKPNFLCVMVKGALQEVQKHMVLHEREGFLIIQELIRRQGNGGFLHADWLDADLRAALEKHSSGKLLPSAQYVSKLLIKKAVTGVKYVDDKGRETSYRRDMLEKEEEDLPAGEEKDGYFCMKEIVEYIPPWEAFCHAKCGFYQDFYKIRWADPYSAVDYGQVENGCADELGVTWEPDENLPPCLDSLRIKTKKLWFTAQSERESKAKRSLDQAPGATADAKRIKLEPIKEEEEKKIDLAQHTRGGDPLERDIFRFHLGHDFAPVGQDQFGKNPIREGWPLHAKDYPTGFSVASPPGFCWAGCDCMDDQRGQREWEVSKNWIPKQRGAHAQMALDNFTQQTSFVRARGQVSKTFYFETAQIQMGETSSQKAAADLALTIQGSLREACTLIPLDALSSLTEPLHLPVRSMISIRGNGDYLPLSIEANLENGMALPPWLELDPASGLFSIAPVHRSKMQDEMGVLFHIKFSEGTVKSCPCKVVPRDVDHKRVLTPIIAQMNDANTVKLDAGMRSILDEQLRDAQSFSFGKLIKILTRCQGWLRASTVANLMLPGR